jgi:hypothetical protein
MGLRLDRVSLRRAGIVLALGFALLAYAPSLARAAVSWQTGPLIESQDSNCVTNQTEQEAGSWLSYYIDPQSPPVAGQTFYVAIDLAGIGDTCAGIYADIELALPSGMSIAPITSQTPVFCYLKFPGHSTYERDTQDCPQSLGAGEYGYSLDPVHSDPPFWPLPQGGAIEIQVPVVASDAGAFKVQGVVQLADGESDPILQPTLETIVDQQATQQQPTPPSVSISYATPTSITSNTFESSGSYPGTTTVTMTGYAWNQNATGKAYVELAYADSAGNCNSPTTPDIQDVDIGALASPNTMAAVTIQDMFPGVAYCWRLDADITGGPAADQGYYYGNWQYFVTAGTYHPNFGPGEPPAAASTTGVAQCGTNGSGCSAPGCTASGSDPTCQTVASPTEALDLTLSGSGSGTVTGPASFSCTASCTGNFATGSTVTLTAAPKSGSSFLGWSGGGCSGTGTCKVTMSAAQSVTADFITQLHLANPTLLVSLTGTGSGKVTSPGGISCPSICSHTYARNASDTLTATAAPGSAFAGWSGGACSGTGTCHVQMLASKSVTAEFTLNPPNTDTLTVSLSGTGFGKVTSAGGISCPTSCDHTYTSGTSDTLTAVAARGSRFTGWSGGGCSGTGTCKVAVSSALGVTANFALEPPSCSLSVVSGKIALRKKRKSPPVDALVVVVKCSQAASARVSGTVSEEVTRKRSKRFKLGSVSAAVSAGVGHAFDLKLPASAIKALKHGHKESVSLSLTASNANGSATARRSVSRLRGSS